jgi:epoxyqueuosine reductase
MWIYGCDVCQEVCPWNRFSKETNETRFLPDQNIPITNLNEFDNMNEKEFNKKFKNSPIRRIKLSGLRRNVKIALENKTSAYI